MTNEAQRIAIAEACGWLRLTGEPQDMLWPCNSYVTGRDGLIMKPPGVTHRHGAPPPDYLNDLNAMHEAEKVLTERERLQYVEEIGKQSRDEFAKTGRDPRSCEDREIIYWHLSATATQRAEAFLRTLNLWQDSDNS